MSCTVVNHFDWLLPLLYLFGSIFSPFLDVQHAWRLAKASSLIALLSVSAASVETLFVPHGGDTLGLLMAFLIAFLGLIIVFYSSQYLSGEMNQGRYVQSLFLTLSGVSVVVLTDNLGMLLAGWVITSIGIHHLLVFYRDRPHAVLAAYKKFTVSRLAEICMVGALALLYKDFGSLSISTMSSTTVASMQLAPLSHVALFLIALAVILKSAQLPFHGWIIQVMEAPTPVSALLHAGIVNLGGFVLIRLGSLLSYAPHAQAALVLIGSVTAVSAGLVMMTRISIKVRLAWSTCSQMGFMLMECGLGLYDLALLHIIAHSIYKAYAFLSAGDTVVEAKLKKEFGTEESQTATRQFVNRVLAVPAAFVVVSLSVMLWESAALKLEIPLVALVLFSIGLAPLLWSQQRTSLRSFAKCTAYFLLLTQLYLVWHILFTHVLTIHTAQCAQLLAWWCCGIFVGLYLFQLWITIFPRGSVAQRIYPWVFSGFYIDHFFTRIVLYLRPSRASVEGREIPTAQIVPSISGVKS